MKIQKITSILALGFSLSACENFGPVNVKIKSDTGFSLKSKNNKVLEFPATNEGHDAIVEFSGKKLELSFGSDKAVFKNAIPDEAKTTITSSPEKSGQRSATGEKLGLRVTKTVICDPNCEEVATEIVDRTCTYNERRPVQRCYRDGSGHPRCTTHWEDYPVRGWERVEVTTILRNLELSGVLFGETENEYANGLGYFREREIHERALTSCR